jgi:thioredoxin 1
MAKPLTLNDANFKDTLPSSDQPVLVDFWASWNSTCKAIAPSITALAEEYEGRVIVAKLDVDANPVTASLFGVSSVPQLLIFEGGELVSRIVGYRTIETLRAELDSLLAVR